MPEAKKIRQLLDVSSERAEDGEILLFNKSTGQWEPHELPDFDTRYYTKTQTDTLVSGRAPLVHASRHATGGADPLTPANIGAPTNATFNSHKARHATGGADPLTPADIGAAGTSHNHDERYYQQSEAEISHDRLRASSTTAASLVSTAHALELGSPVGTRTAYGGGRIQHRNSSGTALAFYINPGGGNVYAGGTASGDIVATQSDLDSHNHDDLYYRQTAAEISHTRMRSEANTSPTLTSTLHSFQAGTSNSTNTAIGNDRIQARNNGSSTILYLNPSGGDVRAGGTGVGNRVLTASDMPASPSVVTTSRTTDLSRTLTTYVTLMSIGSASFTAGTWLFILSADCEFTAANSIAAFRLSSGAFTNPADELVAGGSTGNAFRRVHEKSWVLYNAGTAIVSITFAALAGGVTVRHTHTTLTCVRLGD